LGPQGAFSYRSSDTVAVNLALNRYFCPPWVRLVCMAAALGPMGAGAFAGGLIGTLVDPSLAFTPLFAGAGVVTGVFAGRPLVMLANRWSARRIESARVREGQTTRFELRNDALLIASATGETVQRWEGIHHLIDSPDALILVVGIGAHFIPAHAFQTPEDRQSALEWILEHLPPEAKARSTLRAAS
jgi:hypothetical protein